jgi:hypothetical protein
MSALIVSCHQRVSLCVTSIQYSGGQLRLYWINSRGQQSRGGPPAVDLGVRLTIICKFQYNRNWHTGPSAWEKGAWDTVMWRGKQRRNISCRNKTCGCWQDWTDRGLVSMDGPCWQGDSLRLPLCREKESAFFYSLIGKKCGYEEKFMEKKFLNMKEI